MEKISQRKFAWCFDLVGLPEGLKICPRMNLKSNRQRLLVETGARSLKRDHLGWLVLTQLLIREKINRLNLTWHGKMLKHD